MVLLVHELLPERSAQIFKVCVRLFESDPFLVTKLHIDLYLLLDVFWNLVLLEFDLKLIDASLESGLFFVKILDSVRYISEDDSRQDQTKNDIRTGKPSLS